MGYFITLEGPEGSGKSTQARLLADHLHAQGYAVRLTREPGGTPIGDQIRAVLHSLDNTAMDPHTEILLYAASRAQHVYTLIQPHLAQGERAIVISDRYYDSTLAYQGYGHGLDLDALRQITAFATGGLAPDLTLYLDIRAEEGLSRRRQAAEEGDEWNRMDTHEMAFYRRVREGYHALMQAEPDRWLAFDAAQSINALSVEIAAAVEARLAHAKPS